MLQASVSCSRDPIRRFRRSGQSKELKSPIREDGPNTVLVVGIERIVISMVFFDIDSGMRAATRSFTIHFTEAAGIPSGRSQSGRSQYSVHAGWKGIGSHQVPEGGLVTGQVESKRF
jgi:hypothetical protein